jgi:hypothetical protein
METPIDADDPRHTLLDPLLHIPPFPRQLDGGLDGFDPRVHREDHVVPKHLCDLGGVRTEVGRVEGSGGEGAEVGLGDEGLDETRVAVTLVDGAVGRRVDTGVGWERGRYDYESR